MRRTAEHDAGGQTGQAGDRLTSPWPPRDFESLSPSRLNTSPGTMTSTLKKLVQHSTIDTIPSTMPANCLAVSLLCARVGRRGRVRRHAVGVLVGMLPWYGFGG